MRKILSLLSAIALTSTASTSIIACKENKTLKDLSTIIKNKDLGDIYIGQLLNKPNKAQILTAIKNKNSEASALSVNDFELKDKTTTSEKTTIIGVNAYKGEITLSYNAQEFKQLSGWGKNNGKIIGLNVIFDGTIYVMTENALYKSDIYGNTFERVIGWDKNKNGIALSLISNNNETVYVGTDQGILYKSEKIETFM